MLTWSSTLSESAFAGKGAGDCWAWLKQTVVARTAAKAVGRQWKWLGLTISLFK
jgi:hypothetical protein